jgi:hypothetical protein
MQFNLTMGWPQWVFIGILAFNICYTAVHNGQPQGNHDIRVTLASIVFSAAILTCGGFFG